MQENLCLCGCGQETKIYNQTHLDRGIIKGQHAKYIKGHNSYTDKSQFQPKLCLCGCGNLTQEAKTSYSGKRRKGEYSDYISGHNTTRGETEFRDGERWKKCQNCNIWKSVEGNFYPKKNFDWGSSPCKECYYMSWNTEEYKEQEKKNNWARRWRRHGHELKWFENLYNEQDKSCAICKNSLELKDLRVDHSHSCCAGGWSCGNCIRGLLCVACNLGIGHLNEDPIRFQAAIEYILNYKSL